ncbi:MAG: hypothetical protein Q9195_003842 [Heterodermia aff. obscurata]
MLFLDNSSSRMLTYIFVLLTLEACTKAAILSPREKTSEASLGRSSVTLEPSVDPTLPIVTSSPTATTATNKATQAYSAASSSSTTPGTLGGVSESPDNATTSSNANHGNCHRTSEEFHTTSAGPFCQPKDLEDVWAGRFYSATWDPDFFGHTANVTITLSYTNPPDGMDTIPVWLGTTTNTAGEIEIEMSPDWLQGESRNNLTLSLQSTDLDGSKVEGGPTISLITAPTPSPSPSSSSSSAAIAGSKHSSGGKLGVEIGVPIALVFLAALCIGLFLVLRRRRGRGYLGSRRSRMRAHGEAKLAGEHDLRTTSSRRDSGKDESVQGGVELQPQARTGHRREDSMGGSLISPVSPISSGSRTSNAFRDEIERQRASGRF